VLLLILQRLAREPIIDLRLATAKRRSLVIPSQWFDAVSRPGNGRRSFAAHQRTEGLLRGSEGERLLKRLPERLLLGWCQRDDLLLRGMESRDGPGRQRPSGHSR
jgi:hypothetical protein